MRTPRTRREFLAPSFRFDSWRCRRIFSGVQISNPRRTIMRHLLLLAVVCAALGIATFGFQAQNPPPKPPPTADPYANNAAPGATQFPLAAPAGKDSATPTAAPGGEGKQAPWGR